ncbi:hypothetical protein [Parvibaculum sp.]|uniref:hypothetical protein n=1 Tax=Parvibaculum sp. TaxID=2024848 RepID=UPI00320E97A1
MKQIHPGPLIAANPRLAAVVAALVLYLGLAPALAPTESFIELAGVILPGIEAAMFAAFAALYRDHVVPRASRHRVAIALFVWFAASLAALWLYTAFTRAGIDAYARFGAPPVFGPVN